MSDILSGRVSKHRRDRRVKNCTVLRMMAIMQEGNNEVPKEFLETGRTGRRNAMPDILQAQSVEASSADLPNRLQKLGTTDEVINVAAGPSNSEIGVQKPQEPRPAHTQTQS